MIESCANCGTRIENNETFCPLCGKRLKKKKTEEQIIHENDVSLNNSQSRVVKIVSLVLFFIVFITITITFLVQFFAIRNISRDISTKVNQSVVNYRTER